MGVDIRIEVKQTRFSKLFNKRRTWNRYNVSRRKSKSTRNKALPVHLQPRVKEEVKYQSMRHNHEAVSCLGGGVEIRYAEWRGKSITNSNES